MFGDLIFEGTGHHMVQMVCLIYHGGLQGDGERGLVKKFNTKKYELVHGYESLWIRN